MQSCVCADHLQCLQDTQGWLENYLQLIDMSAMLCTLIEGVCRSSNISGCSTWKLFDSIGYWSLSTSLTNYMD